MLVVLAVLPNLTAQTKPAQPAITGATLQNGMHVVIVRNTLAPVVTVEANFW